MPGDAQPDTPGPAQQAKKVLRRVDPRAVEGKVREVAGRKQRVVELTDEVAELTAEVEQLRQQLDDAQRETRRARKRAQLAEETSRGRLENLGRWGRAYRRLRAASLGVAPATLGSVGAVPGGDELDAHVDAAESTRRRAALADGLAAGDGMAAAALALVHACGGTTDSAVGRRVAQWLHDEDPSDPAGLLATSAVAEYMLLPTLAWERMSQVDDASAMRLAPRSFVLLATQHDPQRAARALDLALSQESAGTDLGLDARDWRDLLRRAMGADLREHVEPLLERFLEAAERELADGTHDDRTADLLRTDMDWLRRWAPRVAAGPPEPVEAPPGTIPFAVLGYDQPDRRNVSVNIGDHVQTIASMAHLVRHTGVRFDDSELGRLAGELAERVPEEHRVGSPEQAVSLYQVDRDASSWSACPDGTWMLAFGWYAHKVAAVRFDLPFTPRVRPLYVSFHVAKRGLLDDAMIEHLREHGPIGCRDWSTVDLLLGAGVPAFFSGCLTTTVRYVSPHPRTTPPDGETVYVDLPAPDGEREIRNERPEVGTRAFVDNLREAVGTLDVYATEVDRVVTRRLHAYLPARSLGREVDFCPKNLADPRFNGLAPLTDEEVLDMGSGIADLLEPVMGAILRGEDEGDVRALWREVTAERVAQAQARREAEVALPRLVDVPAVVRAIRDATVARPATQPVGEGDPVDVVLALDGNLKEQLLVVLDALHEHASRPLRLHVLCRDHDEADFERTARLFPGSDISWYPCDAVDYGDITAMISHITVSTMDRLLLPDLLPELDRVIYHDIDALPVTDVAALFDVDLEGHPIAARDSEASTLRSGYATIFAATDRPHEDPQLAFECVRRECARHPFDFVGFNAGILVLDLARMREDRFGERFIPYATAFGLNDQHVLNLYAGADRLRLDPGWNSRPTQETIRDPRIIHWAGVQKPWLDAYVPCQDVWRRQVDRLRQREDAAAPPNGDGARRHAPTDS